MAGRDDTLARWMANRIAELIAESRQANAGAQKADIDNAIEKLILDLWLHRASLPGNVDPNKRLSKALDILDNLEAKRSFFAQRPYQDTQLEHVAGVLYQLIDNLVMQLTLLKLAENLPDPDEFDLPMGREEVEFREKIQALMDYHVRRSSIFVIRDGQEEAQSDVEILREKIDAGALQATEALASFRHLFASNEAQRESRNAKAKKRPRHRPQTKV